MQTVVKCIDNQEYICQLTSNVAVGDFIIKTFDPIDRPIETNINKIIWSNGIEFKYEKIAGEGNHSFGFDTFKSTTDLSKYVARKLVCELDTLFYKVVAIGNQLN